MSDPESKIKAISRETFNKTCADCPQKAPNYVNLTEYTFVCTTCSGMLRGLNPPHKVKALSMARFTEEDAKMFKERGNKYNREKYLSNFGDYETIPDKDKDPKGFMSFLEKKYSGRFSGARAVEVPVEKVLGYNKPSLVIQSGTKSDRGFGFCKNCGTGKLSDHDRFCHACGAQQSVGGNSPSTTRAAYRDSPTTARASQSQQFAEDPFGNPASPRQDDGGFGAFSSAAPVSSKPMQPQTSSSHLLPGGQRLASVGSIAETLSGQEQQSQSAAMAKADFSLGLGGAAAAWGGKASPVIPRANVGATPPAAAPSGGGGGGEFGDFGGFTSAAPQRAAAAPSRVDDGFGDFASSSSASTSVSPPAPSGSLGLEGLSLGPPAPAPAPTGGSLGLDLAGLFAESVPMPQAVPTMQSQGWGMPTQPQAPPTSMGGWGMPAQAQAPPTSMGGWGMPQQQPGMMQPGMPPQQGGWGMPPQQQGMGGMGGMPMQQQGMGMGMGAMGGGMMQSGMPQQQGGWGMPAQQQGMVGMGGMGGMGGMPMQQQSMGGWGMPPQQQGMGGSIMDSTNEADAAKQKAEKSFAALDVFSSFGK